MESIGRTRPRGLQKVYRDKILGFSKSICAMDGIKRCHPTWINNGDWVRYRVVLHESVDELPYIDVKAMERVLYSKVFIEVLTEDEYELSIIRF